MPGHAGPRSACPDDETLAAFVDRQLDETNRRRVVNHVARCLNCYEVVADSLHFVGLGGAAERRTLELEQAEHHAQAAADEQPPAPTGAGSIEASRTRVGPQVRAALALAALLLLAVGLWRTRPPVVHAPPSAQATPTPRPRDGATPAPPAPSAEAPALVALAPALEARLEDWQVRRQSAFGVSAFSRPCALAAGALSAVAMQARARGASAQLEALARWPAWGLRGCNDEWRRLAADQVRRVQRGQDPSAGGDERAAWVRLGHDLEAWSAWSQGCTGRVASGTNLPAARPLFDDHPLQARLEEVVSLTEEATPWSAERCQRLGARVSDLRTVLLN